ncbi:MAG: hypothetical protein HXL13_01480 [Candidatus Nanosynbacter sp.]|nr:hypothetical protein [Candidatus Nanosynbacter sp.]
MAKRLSELGFKGAFCTSHYIADSPQAADNQTKNHLREKLQAELDKAGIKLKLLPGNEIYIDPKMVDYLTKGKASCLGGELSSKKKHQHVLFELPFYAEVSYLRDIIFELKAKGLVPILAHPERYLFVQKKKEVIFELKKLGVKLQSNYGSIVGQYGGKAKKIMKFLLKNRLVSYLGTDIHRAEGSLFLKFEKAEKKIIKLIGEPEYRKIIERGDELAKPFLNN